MGTSGNKVKYKSYVTVFVCACVLCFEEIFSSVQVINKISSTPQRREDIFAKTMTMGKMCKKLSSEKLFENILSLHFFVSSIFIAIKVVVGVTLRHYKPFVDLYIFV